eukprot:TRINITY_DN12518_c0_g1_i1.p1 TRINITY_DN12518_c0_g1~~TRINITY_DN12518_c0_g1_i1.p1  ORF type:complete len:107 (-),score=0.35 TRINITY_DN12518_c0_g1_i1:37-357(-)
MKSFRQSVNVNLVQSCLFSNSLKNISIFVKRSLISVLEHWMFHSIIFEKFVLNLLIFQFFFNLGFSSLVSFQFFFFLNYHTEIITFIEKLLLALLFDFLFRLQQQQ